MKLARIKEVAMSGSDPLSVFQKVVDAINAHDVDTQVSYFHPNYESRLPCHPSENFTGNDQVRKNWSALMGAVPDLRLDLERWAVNGSEVWTELHVHGRRTDESPFDVRGVIIATVEDGLLTQGRIFLEEVQHDGANIDDAIAEWTSGDAPD